jgi:hypothetical protein
VAEGDKLNAPLARRKKKRSGHRG